jgi:hypothetical protein
MAASAAGIMASISCRSLLRLSLYNMPRSEFPYTRQVSMAIYWLVGIPVEATRGSRFARLMANLCPVSDFAAGINFDEAAMEHMAVSFGGAR